MSSLAERLRPSARAAERLVGPAAKIWQRDLKLWRNEHKHHIVFWGPPGSGKTTLANMLAESSGLQVTQLSAVRDGVKEIRAAVDNAPGEIVFIDEIHRLNKAQQDVLLPIMEKNMAWILGATTESPTVSLNPAILSRVRTIYVASPKADSVSVALLNGLKKLAEEHPEKDTQHVTLIKNIAEDRLAKIAAGDVRLGLNLLESIFFCESPDDVEEVLKNIPRAFTAKKHYDWVSAMIKSLRGSSPDAALFYAMTALDSGEDPLFIFRRCVIFASEDVGNADPQALAIAVNGMRAFEAVGLPEGRIPLAQVVTYLASTVKSNKAYLAIETVRQWRTQAIEIDPQKSLAPPPELTRAGSEHYKYPHDFPNAFVKTRYLPETVAEIKKQTGPAYRPSDFGVEARLKERLQSLWDDKKQE